MTHYKNIRPSGSDTGAPLNLKRRLKLINQYIDFKNKTILDAGCGTGDYLIKFLDSSPHVYGIEYDPEKVRIFQSLNIPAAKVKQGDIEHSGFEENKFDLVLLNEVLEHVPNDFHALKEAYRILKPNGILALFSPNRFYPFETHGVSTKKNHLKIPYYIPFIPYIPIHLGNKIFIYNARNYFPWELKRNVEQNNFKIIEQTCVWQTFENISGSSPKMIVYTSPFLRALSFCLEKIPLVRWFGISQCIIAQKQR